MYKYTNQTKIENFLERSLTAKEILRLQSVILAVGRDIFAFTGRQWQDYNDEWASGVAYIIGNVVNLSGVIYQCSTNHTSSSTTRPGTGTDFADYWDLYLVETVRYFDGNGKKELYIDDFISISQVDFLDSMGDVYMTVEDSTLMIFEPANLTVKESLHLIGYIFPNRAHAVKITGIWGSGVCPEDVTYVATVMASSLLEEGGESAEFVKESIEGYSYEKNLSNTYKSKKELTLQSLETYKRFQL